MPPDQRPPRPGPQPERLEFPFDQAQAALDAINDLVEQLGDLKSAVDQGLNDLNSLPFEGEFATWFTGAGDDLEGTIDSRITALETQADDLVTHISDARQSIRDRDVSRYGWQQSHDAWADWKPPASTASATPR